MSFALVARAVALLRRRGRSDHASISRVIVFGIACGLVCVVVLPPLDRIAEEELLSAHMLQHVVLGDLTPALAVFALRGPLVFFLLPAFVLRRLARLSSLRNGLAFVLRPVVSFAIWVAALSLWHLPPAYDYALAHPSAHALEHASFVVGGALVWLQLIDPARRHRLRTTGRLLFLLAVFAATQGLATTLIAAPDAIYAAYAHPGTGRFGLTAASDQDYAAIIMMLEQLLTLGTCAGFLLREHVAQAKPTIVEGDRHPLAF